MPSLGRMAKQTGPRTDASKRTSSENSLGHGCRSRLHRVLKGESEAEFSALEARWFDEYSTYSEIDAAMIERVVHAEWRMRRCERHIAQTEEFLSDTPVFEWSEEQHKLLSRVRKYYSEAVRFYNMARRDLDSMRLTRQREIVAVYRSQQALDQMPITEEEEEQRAADTVGYFRRGPQYDLE